MSLSSCRAFHTHHVQGAARVRWSPRCFTHRRQSCRQGALPAVPVKPETCWTDFTLRGQEVRERWFSTVKGVMHTQSSGKTVSWWLLIGLPECEGSQPAASKRDQISSQLVVWCYINSGMRWWHLIRTKRAAGEDLCTHCVPCSFKSTTVFCCPWVHPPWGLHCVSIRQIIARLSHHCTVNEGPPGESLPQIKGNDVESGSSRLWQGRILLWAYCVTDRCLSAFHTNL